MRKFLYAVTAASVLAGPVAVAVAPSAGAAPGSAHEAVRADASATLLGARALTGLSQRHDALDVNLAVAHAGADSTAPSTRRSTADAANFRITVGGHHLPLPTVVSQHAGSDHAHPTTADLDLSHTPLAPAVRARLLQGSAQARWNGTAAPPAGQPISRSSTTAADLTLLGAGMKHGLTAPDHLLTGFTRQALVTLPGTVRSTAQVSLRDVPGRSGRAVVATSTVRIAKLSVFAGSSSEIQVRVVADPVLTAVSTGHPGSSTVNYRAPILEVRHSGHTLGRLDARHPSMDVPLVHGLPRQLNLGAVRLSLGKLATHRRGAAVSGTAALLDVKVLPVGHDAAAAELTVGSQAASALAPTDGVNPTPPGNPGNPGNPGEPGNPGNPGNPGGPGNPPGHPGGPGAPPAQPGGPGDHGGSGQSGPGAGDVHQVHNQTGPLASTNAAYNPLPIFLIGGALLLVGSVLVAAVPRRMRRRRGTTTV